MFAQCLLDSLISRHWSRTLLSTYSLRFGAVRNIIGKGQAICNDSSKAASYVKEVEVALDGEEVVSA
jgi:hypothetical protein